jgi:hypothetical protein
MGGKGLRELDNKKDLDGKAAKEMGEKLLGVKKEEVVPVPPDGIESAEVVRLLNNLRKHEDTVRKPHESEWDDNWDIFNKQYDWSSKAAWQSKVADPKLNNAIFALTFLLKKALVSSGDDFFINKPWDNDIVKQELAIDQKKIIQYYLGKDKGNFIDAFGEALQASFLCGACIGKIYPVKQKNGHLIKIDPVSPYRVHWDSTGLNRYVIHRTTVDLDVLIKSSGIEGGYDKKEVEKILSDWVKQTEEAKERQQRNETLTGIPEFRKRVTLDEFWGTIWRADGTVYKDNATYTVANEINLIRSPLDNPLPEGKFPFIIGFPLRKAFSNYHQPLASNAAAMNRVMTELLNLELDANYFDAIPSFELNVDLVLDPQQILNGYTPGKMFKKGGISGLPDQQMLRQIAMKGGARETLSLYQKLDNIADNSSATTQFVMGNENIMRERPTAEEVRSSGNRADSYLQMIAEGIEEQFIEPFISQFWEMLIQFPPDLQELYNILGAEETNWIITHGGLKGAFGNRWTFTSKGMSAVLSRAEELVKLANFFGMIQKLPQQVQTAVLQRLNIEQLLDKAIINMGWDPKQIKQDIKNQAGIGGGM